MVAGHRQAKARRIGRTAFCAAAFGHCAGLVEQLVAVEGSLRIPMEPSAAESDGETVPAPVARSDIGGGGNPFLQRRLDLGFEDLGFTCPPILPWKERIPIAPGGVSGAGQRRGGGERKIADRDEPLVRRLARRIAAAIAESVELLDITELEPGQL